MVALAACCASGCVTTAECDQTTPCDDSEAQVCFDFVCRQRCERDEECGAGERCASCEASNACYGERARACVEREMTGSTSTAEGGAYAAP